MKSVLDVLLICVALCIVSTSVFVAPNAVSIDRTLSDDGVLAITGSGVMANCSGSPSSVPWYNSKDKITSVVVSKGITSIGDYVLQNCTNLKSITFPDSVTSIGNSASSVLNVPRALSSQLKNKKIRVSMKFFVKKATNTHPNSLKNVDKCKSL